MPTAPRGWAVPGSRCGGALLQEADRARPGQGAGAGAGATGRVESGPADAGYRGRGVIHGRLLSLADIGLRWRCGSRTHGRFGRRNRDVHSGLDAFDALQQRGFGIACRGQQQPGAHHFEEQSGCRGTLISPSPACTTSAYRAKVAGPIRAAWSRIRSRTSSGASTTPRLAASGTAWQHDQIAEAFQEVHTEPARVMPGVDDRFDGTEQRGGVRCDQCVDGVVDECDVSGSEQCQRPLVMHQVVLSTRQKLVENAQRVAGRTAAGTNDQRKTASSIWTFSDWQIRSIRERIVRGASNRNG